MSFNPNDFVKKLADFVRRHPRFASRAYAEAARKMSEAAARDPKNRFGYQMIANRLNEFAAQAQLPAVEWESGDIHALFADTPPGASIATEWDSLVADMEASKIGPDGNQNSELVSAFLADRFHARTMSASEISPEGAPVGATEVNLTPGSTRSGSPLFGASALVQFGGSNSSGSVAGSYTGSGSPIAQQEAQVIAWNGKEDETMVVTVAISRVGAGAGATYGSQPATPLSYRPFFRVQWGTSRAAPAQAVGDVGVGVQFSVSTAFLYVSVGMDPPQTNLSPGSMYLGGTMGFYGSARYARVNRTLYIDSLNDSASSTIALPAFATELTMVEMSGSGGTYTLQFADQSGAAIVSFDGIQGAQVAAIPIPGDAVSVTLTNTSGNNRKFRLLFGLSL